MTMRGWIGLGANLGAPEAVLRAALEDIRALPGVRLVAVSSFYSTSPVDSSGPDYVNAVAEVEFERTPEALLLALQSIENRHGRVRPVGVHNAPRTLDLDLLDVEGVRRTDAFLTLPHPRMTERLFVLVPLAEIAPSWRSPGGDSAEDLARHVRIIAPAQKVVKVLDSAMPRIMCGIE